MTIKNWCSLLLLLLNYVVVAQVDTITRLQTVYVADNTLKKFSNSQRVFVLNDSIIAKNHLSLTSLLNFNSPIYFKENGLGMVSSPSFRGTTAQQTAVIWNGININSQLNGQTDFNVISTSNYNTIAVRSGGGSVIYGSSAIGGSVHLNNELEFKNQFKNEIQINFGSFKTRIFNYKLLLSTAKLTTDFSLSRVSSTNDYPYLDTDLNNQNGAFYNTSFNLNFGYKINNCNQLKIYNQIFESNRNLSGTLATDSKSNYKDFNTRTLLEWIALYNKFTSVLKFAYLSEQYRYYEDKDYFVFSDGKAENFISRYDLSYKVNSKITFNSILDYTKTIGLGTNISQNQRNVFSSLLLMKHQIVPQILYEIGVRKEITSTYNSPVLYSLGIKFKPFSWYSFRVNGSKNFRIPTFNDLYWQGLGNSSLQPEIANQVELGHDFLYKGCSLSITAFVINIDDMIQWSPNSSGVWSPKNVKNVLSKGIETSLGYEKKYKKHTLFLNSNYSFTASEDQVLKKQLIYVPFHKVTFAASYSYKNVGLFYQFLFNGKVFTSSDNEYNLKNYKLSNVGVDFKFGTIQSIKITFQINNILNQNYQNVAVRPMPGRNFNLITNFKF